jgi:diguanylate cyclase (GGDEF)-like protein
VVVAQALRSNARRVDVVVARYGSDEFVDLMPTTSLVGGRHFFERVRAEVTERSMLVLGFPVRLSAGAVKLHHDDAGDPRDFLETADQAMYVAKRQGKNRLFTPWLSAMPRPGGTLIRRCKARVLVTNEPRTSLRRVHGSNARSLQ